MREAARRTREIDSADSEEALAADGLGKSYRLEDRSARSRLQRLWRPDQTHLAGRELWAVRDVSFALAHGASLGIVGRNGAGKSTLLRLLAGTARPTEGRVRASARVGCLLDLGVGFHPLETGRQNAEAALVLQGGLTWREARRRANAVAEMADIGAFFDRPLRTCSTGMQLRVAFATATLLEPEVLITDEVLVVGDETFQRKCSEYFDRFLAGGGTLVLCSHDLSQIRHLCERALWLDNGRVRAHGPSRDVVREYRDSIGEPKNGEAAGSEHEIGARAGLPFEVVDLHLRDLAGSEVRELEAGASVVVTADLHAPAGVPQVFIGITRADLTPIYGVSSDMDGAEPECVAPDLYRYRLTFLELPLTGGAYRLRAHALDETGTRLYDTVEIHFSVAGEDGDEGLVRLAGTWRAES